MGKRRMKGSEMEKPTVTVPILAAVILAFFIAGAPNAETASAKGGKAGMKVKGQNNSGGQWLADPEKGWVRTEEAHQLHKGEKETSKRNQVNRKGKGSKKNF